MARFGGSGAVRRSDVVRVFALVVVDVFALYEAFVLAYIQRASAAKPLAHHVSVSAFSERVAVVAPLWAAVFAVCGLYSAHLDARRASEVMRVIVAVLAGVTSLIVWDYLSPDSPMFPSRSIPVWAVLYGVALVLFCRFLVRRAMQACFARGLGLQNVILIGSGDLATQIASEMTRPRQGYRVVAAVDARRDGGQLSGGERVNGIPVFGSLEAAVGSKPHRIDEIMQADDDLARTEIARMMNYANANGISYRFVPDQYGVYAAASSATTVGGIPVLELRLTALDGWGAVGKRCFDLIGSALLIALLWPVLLAVAVAVKLSEPDAPVLYRQDRLGKNGRPIRVLKFRSMSWRYSTGPNREFKTAPEAFLAMDRSDLLTEFAIDHKVASDPRVSAVGGFLRRSSLDELPQLFNVFRGDVSLVGPRPITTTEIGRYGDRHASFLALKPGITGLWQVSGRSEITYHERVKLDVFYVENWSLALDLTILFRTVRTVAARKGAH